MHISPIFRIFALVFRTQLFGKKSEKRLSSNPDDLQPTLFDDLLTPEEKQEIEAKRKQEQQEVTKAVSYTRKAKNNRAVLNTEGLPVEEEVLLPDGINDQTLPLYTELEPKVTNKLCIRPAQVYIKRIIRRQFVLKSSHQQKESNNATFLIAPLPESSLYKCMADTSILVDIFIDKYLYHLPFHRVIQKYKELGVQLNDTTIYDWFAATCVRLRPIYDSLYKHILTKDYIQIDESTLPVVSNKDHRAVKGYIWVLRSVEDGALYFYYKDGSRSAQTALMLLSDYTGTIQCDGYQAYDKFENKKGITVIGCWVHARRYFVRAKDSSPQMAEKGLDYISKLYKLEDIANELSLSTEERCTFRKEKALPIIREFEQWIETSISVVRSGSPIYEALRYCYTYLPRLARYILDGKYLLDNNKIESSIRPLAVGRNGYLFCDNHNSAIRAAIAYSLIDSCKNANIDPRKWLTDVLNKSYKWELKGRDFSELLPHNWGKQEPK